MLLIRQFFSIKPLSTIKKKIRAPRVSPILINKINYCFCSQKRRIDQQLMEFAQNLKEESIKQDYSETVNNYIQLQEQSFIEYAKKHKNDPQMMLMFLSTIQDSQKVAQYLPMLYPHIDYLQKTQLLLLLQKVLAFKPRQIPKVPFPKPLQGIESILVIMSEIYKADSLIQWIKLVPIYNASQYCVLLMGYFSILQKMSAEVKNRNQNLLIKCHNKIQQILQDPTTLNQIKIGILILSFELNYGQSVLLLTLTQLDLEKMDPYKIFLLYIYIQKFQVRNKKVQKQQLGPKQQKIQSQFKKVRNKLLQKILKLQFEQFMKINLFMEMFRINLYKKQLRANEIPLFHKVLNLVGSKKYIQALKQLDIQQLIVILQVMQKHKVNNQRILKQLLVLLSPHLYNMDKKYFIKLLKCLVTYVRQAQDYLINVRKVLEERKLQFDQKQAMQINSILRRVQVLFPVKFTIN